MPLLAPARILIRAVPQEQPQALEAARLGGVVERGGTVLPGEGGAGSAAGAAHACPRIHVRGYPCPRISVSRISVRGLSAHRVRDLRVRAPGQKRLHDVDRAPENRHVERREAGATRATGIGATGIGGADGLGGAHGDDLPDGGAVAALHGGEKRGFTLLQVGWSGQHAVVMMLPFKHTCATSSKVIECHEASRRNFEDLPDYVKHMF